MILSGKAMMGGADLQATSYGPVPSYPCLKFINFWDTYKHVYKHTHISAHIHINTNRTCTTSRSVCAKHAHVTHTHICDLICKNPA